MEPDVDEAKHPGLEDLEWGNESVKGQKPKGLYSRTSETARGLISTERQCALFCGGKKCKYCSCIGWEPDEMALKGLYCHWVTDNILAMARPSNDCIKKHDLVQQFLDEGIKSIINLQIAGEHADCGPHELDPSGFLYNPQSFMEREVFFYNFGWPDYGVASLSTILDMVKVMQFAVSEGKVAVHCHAGRGRTGVIIACYLVFTNRISGQEAIHYVRDRRPHSIQTRPQMEVIEEFAKYLKPFRTVFASREKGSHEFSLQQFLNRQRHILHGYEARRLKYVPKVIYTVCQRLLELAKNRQSSQTERKETTAKPQNLDKAKENQKLKPTFATLPKSKPESLSEGTKWITQTVSKDSLSSLGKKKRYKKSLATRRDRRNSISMEDLDNEDFKKVLADPDTSSISSRSSSKSRNTINEEYDDDDDDDSCIVYGNSLVNLQATANNERHGISDDIKSRLNGNGVNWDTESVTGSMMSEWSIDGLSITSSASDSHVQMVANALSVDEVDEKLQSQAIKHETELNECDLAWESLSNEENPYVLSLVLWDWLDHLKEPVLRAQDLQVISQCVDEPKTGLKRIEKGTRFTIEYLVKVLLRLKPLREETLTNIYEKLLSHLTHQWVLCGDAASTMTWAGTMKGNSDKEHWKSMKPDMANSLVQFFFNLQAVMDVSRDSK